MQNIKGITMKQKAMEQEMMEQEQKENLLRLLDDQDVKDKIIELCHKKESADENRFFKEGNASLAKELRETKENAQREIASLKNNIKKLKEEKSETQKKMEDLKKALKPYEDNITMYETYHGLSLKTRKALSSVINTKTPIVFIASCSDPDHLKSVWNYTKTLLWDDNSENEIDLLKKTITYMMEIINSVGAVPLYEPIVSEPGRKYKDESHCKGPGSKSAGTIQQVLLEGYRQINTGNIICKSVVIV